MAPERRRHVFEILELSGNRHGFAVFGQLLVIALILLNVVAVIVGSLPIRLTPMTATCRVPPLSRVKLGIGWSRGVARDAEQ